MDLNQITIPCRDYAASVEFYRKLGFRQIVDSQRWLWRETYTRDPAGNVICIYHAGANRRFPPWRLDDDAGQESAP